MARSKLTIGVAIAAGGLFYLAAQAAQSRQQHGGAAEPLPQHEHMSHGEMGRVEMSSPPMHRLVLTTFALPDFQQELSLSSKQLADLRSLRSSLEARQKDVAGKIAYRQKQLDLLLQGDTSRTQTVKRLFSEISALKSQLGYATFETLGKMKAALDESQRAKLDAIRSRQLHETVIRSGKMASMHELLRTMGQGDAMDGMGTAMGENGGPETGMDHGPGSDMHGHMMESKPRSSTSQDPGAGSPQSHSHSH